jgi:serine/threonine protein kinase/Leucine-rich repeat (LRR) protein
LLVCVDLVHAAGRTDNHAIEKRLTFFANSGIKPEMRDLEEALLQAVLCGASDNIAPLILAGARRLDCALHLAIQQEQLKAVAMLLLCKATISGDCQAIRVLISEPTNPNESLWYMPEVHRLLVQGTVKMYCPIAVSIMVRNYDATKELLLCTDLDMRRKTVDWSRLKLTLLHSSWIYSIAPWVVNLKLGNNNLRRLPDEFLRASQLRRLDLSTNLIDAVTVDLFSLPNLEWLNLSQNKIRELPEDINWSPSLINLDLSSNHLSNLPSSIQNSMLEILQLSKNRFTVLPKCVCRIRTLTTLDLSSMPISSLPKEIEMLERLANLNVSECNISDLPAGMHNLGGSRFTRGFVKSRSRSSKPSNLAKVIILSNSSVGKLVMFSRLRQIQCPHSSHLPEMELFQWSFRPLIKVLTGPKVIFNTWMIGVQKDFRYLYPTLYSANALYIIVWDMTKTGDIQQQLRPYVDGISRHFPTANILVIAILPEPSELWADANVSNLNKKLSYLFSQPGFNNLQYHGLLILANSTSPKDLSTDIRLKIYEIITQMTLNGLPIIGRPVPENYFNLLPIVEKEHTTLRASDKPGILEENTLWGMFEAGVHADMPDIMELPVIVSFLQESGYLMHFDDPNNRLNHYYFLHPEWIISKMHQILCHLHNHHVTRPTVTLDKLNALTKLGSEKNPIKAAIVRLMVRFTLLLPISDNTFLIPSLLPHNSLPLALLQNGCYRRQFIPKGKSLPEEFWFYMISHVLFHLPRLFNSQEQIVKNFTENRLKVNSKESSASDLAFPEDIIKELEQSTPPPEIDYHHVSTAKTRSLTDDVMQHHHDPPRQRSRGSQYKLSRLSHDPIEISRGIQVWNTGIHLTTTTNIELSVYSQTSDLGLEESGIEVCATGDIEGRCVMAKVCWLIQKLLEQRYPEFSHQIHASSQIGLTQIILCPKCMRDRAAIANGGVTNFIIETCLVAIKENESTFTHNCHHHEDPIPLDDLVPEYVLVDLPSELKLEPNSFVYQESRPVYRDSNTILCDGQFNNQLVTVKKNLFSDGKSYTVPLSAMRQELEMLTFLNHPNIIKTFGFCLSPPIVLLERSPMGTLLQKLSDNEQKISRLVRFHIARQIGSALTYLHKRDIIYRTLKSDSILTWSLNFEDEVSIKLAHFDRASFTTPNGLKSRPDFSFYPAPEMVRYEFTEEYTTKVDIYSFGVLLYELVARWQPFAFDKITMAHKPRLTGLSTYGFQTLVKLMEECWEEDATSRPSAHELVGHLSNPKFQCHLSTQVLRDCISVRGCCFIPSVRQVWAYGEYNLLRENSIDGTELMIEGTQVFILNAANLTVQGSLELKERANAICTVDSKVWVGMLEGYIHVYDSVKFNFTNRIYVKDSVTCIATNDRYAFVGQANGLLTYYEKHNFPEACNSISVGAKAIISMVPVGETLWVICGNEIITVGTDEDEDHIKILHRLTVCRVNDQLYQLVVSHDNKFIWSTVRGSLTLTCWDVSSCIQCGYIDLTESIQDMKGVSDDYNPRLLSLECSQDVLWVGMTTGIILLLTAEPQPRLITWFKAHQNNVRCLMSIPDNDNEYFYVVFSGGFGEESYLKTQTSKLNGVIMSWQSLNCKEFQILADRGKLL